MGMESDKIGLKKFRTGEPRTTTAPKHGSKTQLRKSALRSYSPEERIRGRVVKAA